MFWETHNQEIIFRNPMEKKSVMWSKNATLILSSLSLNIRFCMGCFREST